MGDNNSFLPARDANAKRVAGKYHAYLIEDDGGVAVMKIGGIQKEGFDYAGWTGREEPNNGKPRPGDHYRSGNALFGPNVAGVFVADERTARRLLADEATNQEIRRILGIRSQA